MTLIFNIQKTDVDFYIIYISILFNSVFSWPKLSIYICFSQQCSKGVV